MRYNGIVNNSAERSIVTHSWVYWDDWFTNDELREVTEYSQHYKEPEKATIFGDVPVEEYRVSKTSFIEPREDNNWFFQKLNAAITTINDRWYGFELNGYPSFQYTEYHAEEKGRYDWHMDMHHGFLNNFTEDLVQPRKLSLSLMLNTDYEGGEFQINSVGENKPEICEKKVGRIIAFPSYIMHRVTPVTSGMRRSIVVWVTGPKFS